MRFVVRYSFPTYFQEQHWTVGREITTISAIIILIAVANFFYITWFSNIPFDISRLIWAVISVIAIGIFPISFGVIANYIYKLKKYSKPVEIIPHLPEPQSQLILLAENEKDTIEIAAKDLLYIESADNYSTIYTVAEKGIKKELIRSSLRRIETQLNNSRIVRCHRSFIVNLDKVVKVSGNAQGYKFHLSNDDIVVPVARRYSSLVEKLH